jgi:hypothetical protein
MEIRLFCRLHMLRSRYPFLTPHAFRAQLPTAVFSWEQFMTRELSLFGRLTCAAAAIALLTASLAAPAAAMPLTSTGFGPLDRDISRVQQQKPPQGKPPGPGGKPNWHGSPNGQHGGQWHGGQWHGGGGGGGPGWVVPGLAFGFLGAAAAAAAYGAPPQPGMCWYYDDPMHSSGHWDYC